MLKATFLSSRFIATSLLFASIAPLTAHAALFADNDARRAILELKSEVKILNQQLKAAQDTILKQNNQIDQLNQNIANLTGNNQDLAYQLKELDKQTQTNYTLLDQRLKKIEPQQETINGVSGLVLPQEAADLNTAEQAFQNKRYQDALNAFTQFIKRYPNSPNQATAQFWLGNSAYALKRYSIASQAWRKLIQTYPEYTLTPNAMFFLANIDIEQKRINDAKRTLRTLIKNYPNAPIAKDAQKRLAALK